MKIDVERNDLLRVMSRAQSIVERRTTIPILSNILIEAHDNKVSCRTTDLDIEIIDMLEATIEGSGAVTVNANTLYEIVRKLKEGARLNLQHDQQKGRLELRSGRSSFSLATLSKDDFPMMASSEYECNFSIPSNDLRRLLEKSKFAMSSEETRYYLNGVYLHCSEENGKKTLRAVATDGHRLARIDCDLPDVADQIPGVIIPRKTVGEVRSILDGIEERIAVSVSPNKIRFSNSGTTITSKVIDGTFPDYSRVIPKENKNRMEVDADEFSKAVDRVSTVSLDKARAVKLILSEDKLLLSVNSPESGAANEELIVAYSDEKIEIGFNAKYLQELASQVEKENAVFFFKSSGDPALMQEGKDDSAIYVVMPMRV